MIYGPGEPLITGLCCSAVKGITKKSRKIGNLTNKTTKGKGKLSSDNFQAEKNVLQIPTYTLYFKENVNQCNNDNFHWKISKPSLNRAR